MDHLENIPCGMPPGDPRSTAGEFFFEKLLGPGGEINFASLPIFSSSAKKILRSRICSSIGVFFVGVVREIVRVAQEFGFRCVWCSGTGYRLFPDPTRRDYQPFLAEKPLFRCSQSKTGLKRVKGAQKTARADPRGPGFFPRHPVCAAFSWPTPAPAATRPETGSCVFQDSISTFV